MILVDANILVYAWASSLPQHDSAHAWLTDRLNDPTPVGLPWASLLAFVRVVSNPHIVARPRPVAEAWRQVELWLDQPMVWVPQPTNNHRHILGRLLTRQDLRSKLVPDAHLAALALEHGLTLCSTDGDFARFLGLRWQNPIARS